MSRVEGRILAVLVVVVVVVKGGEEGGIEGGGTETGGIEGKEGRGEGVREAGIHGEGTERGGIQGNDGKVEGEKEGGINVEIVKGREVIEYGNQEGNTSRDEKEECTDINEAREGKETKPKTTTPSRDDSLPLQDDSALCQCDSKRPSRREKRFITYTGIGIGALAMIVFGFFLKYLLYFSIRKYFKEDARMLKNDLDFLTSLLTHLEEEYY